MKQKYNCIVMGAAGRDFHIFLSFLRNNEHFRVKAFTATQIPFIGERELMHKASLVQAAGASFVMLCPEHTQLKAEVPVVSITATRTGAGKSPLTQWLARSLIDKGKRVAVIRHPMPYGNLNLQRVQRFAVPEDLDEHDCTIEEREEYEPYVEMGIPIYAGVDYQAILDEAQRDVDLVMWDGGNNDFSFIRPDLDIVVVDALRAGHEIDYFPGEVNFRRADILVISKADTAAPGAVNEIRERAGNLNPDAVICTADLEISVDQPDLMLDQRVLVIEDGPRRTYGDPWRHVFWCGYRCSQLLRQHHCGSTAIRRRHHPRYLCCISPPGTCTPGNGVLRGTTRCSARHGPGLF